MSQYFLNWKTPNHALRIKDEKPDKTLVDRTLKPLRLSDPQGTEATIVSGAHPGTTRIRVERFVGLDEVIATPPNVEVQADLLYLAADTNAARPSKKYKILIVDQENSTLTILGEPIFTGISEWRVIRCPRIVLIDPWAARVGGNAAVAVPNFNRPAIKLDLSGSSENEVFSKINSNFDTIYFASELPELAPSEMRRANLYLIVGVDPNNPIIYLDKQPTLPVMGSPWILPVGALTTVELLPYQLEPQDDGCDHYNGRAFIVFDGKIQGTICCSSYTSTRAKDQKRASITGNELLLFQSWLSSKDSRNFSLMIYDSLDSTGKPIDIIRKAAFYFWDVTANRHPTTTPFPITEPDTDGKSQIRFHYGRSTGRGTGSEGCLVSPEYYNLRSTLAQLYNDHRRDLGLTPDNDITEIGGSRNHDTSTALWNQKTQANLPDHWSGRLRGLLVLVRPSQKRIEVPVS